MVGNDNEKRLRWVKMALLTLLGATITCLGIATKREEVELDRLLQQEENARTREQERFERWERAIEKEKLKAIEDILESYENNHKDTDGRDNGRRQQE